VFAPQAAKTQIKIRPRINRIVLMRAIIVEFVAQPNHPLESSCPAIC
jgi:hypothetical protein